MLRQTPGNSGRWQGAEFTFEPVEECDVVCVLNHVPVETTVNCAPENVWALMQEPYANSGFEWIVEGHDPYHYVLTHHPGNHAVREKYVQCHPAVPWHINKNYDELISQEVPGKQKTISCIASNLTTLPGHKTRMAFLADLKSRSLAVDYYGKGTRYIEDKWDGLAPYRYSLAIENSSSPDYWTEKLADCYLSWTLPVYYGCTNLDEYFPTDSFIRIDINRPVEALEIITRTLAEDDWEARLPALEKARQLVLNKYQFFPQIHNFIENHYQQRPAEKLVLLPYVKKTGFMQKFRSVVPGIFK